MPQAQRVTGCVAPRSGLALTRRWDQHPRYSFVGKSLADLPSGERVKKKAVGTLQCRIYGENNNYQYRHVEVLMFCHVM